MKIIDDHQVEFAKVIEHYQREISTLKTGRANPAVLDGIMVECYGARTSLPQMASVSVPEARSILIQPWDKSIMKEVEKALRESDLNLSVSNEGERLRITVPQMTEETRKEIVKILRQKTEQARIALRTLRDEIKEKILAAEKNKEFGEDEKYNLAEALDKRISDENEKIKEIGGQREREIMTV